MVSEDEIKRRAYSLWEEEGRPEGKQDEHYFRASRILEGREAMDPSHPIGRQPPVVEPPPAIPNPLPKPRSKPKTKKTR